VIAGQKKSETPKPAAESKTAPKSVLGLPLSPSGYNDSRYLIHDGETTNYPIFIFSPTGAYFLPEQQTTGYPRRIFVHFPRIISI
jgi:hypothetical protein